MALYPDWQDRLAEEARTLKEDFSGISRLRLTHAGVLGAAPLPAGTHDGARDAKT